MKEVALIPTGIANIASVKSSFLRLNAKISELSCPDKILTADYVVLPGVGSFGPGIEYLQKSGISDAIVERFKGDRPNLCICLGFQLLGTQSEESAGTNGLSLYNDSARHFPEGVTTPQFGWNLVTADKSSRFVNQSGYAYFANSYYLPPSDTAWKLSLANEQVDFVAAMEKGSTLACQFHPELSGRYGEDILSNWLN